jgi:hypothetical protein
MKHNLPLVALVVSLLPACLAEPTDSASSSNLASTAAAPLPVPALPPPPHILGLAWHWDACDPSVPPGPVTLTVKVALEYDDGTIKVSGQATDCDPFFGNPGTAACAIDANADDHIHHLEVQASNASGDDKASTPIDPCVDGEAWFTATSSTGAAQ